MSIEYEFTDEQLRNVSIGVLETAMAIFNACHNSPGEDFGIQSIGQRVIFGGHNRLIFTASNSRAWSVSEYHCSTDFKRRFHKLVPFTANSLHNAAMALKEKNQ